MGLDLDVLRAEVLAGLLRVTLDDDGFRVREVPEPGVVPARLQKSLSAHFSFCKEDSGGMWLTLVVHDPSPGL